MRTPVIHVDSDPIPDHFVRVPSTRDLFDGIRATAGIREMAVLTAPDLRCYLTSDYPGCVRLSSRSLGKFFLYRWSDKTIVG